MGDSILYNDNDPYVCAWLRELIKAGHLPEGTVDERSILDVRPEDCGAISHFFAGIGGWPYALRLAGWPDDRPVWTASLPCQPWSAAGKSGGVGDDRHLWPAFHALVAECRPPVIFGEQVEAAIGLGWLDGVFADLEGLGYACGAAILPAAGVGAPHIRSRIFWVADADAGRFHARRTRLGEATRDQSAVHAGRYGADGGMAQSAGARRTRRTQRGDMEEAAQQSSGRPSEPERRCKACGWINAQHDIYCAYCGLGNAERAEGARQRRNGDAILSDQEASQHRESNPWSRSEVIYCRDGKWRRIPLEPAFQPLAPGVSAGRVGLLRGAGNAICPPLAAQFVMAYMEIEQ